MSKAKGTLMSPKAFGRTEAPLDPNPALASANLKSLSNTAVL